MCPPVVLEGIHQSGISSSSEASRLKKISYPVSLREIQLCRSGALHDASTLLSDLIRARSLSAKRAKLVELLGRGAKTNLETYREGAHSIRQHGGCQ